MPKPLALLALGAFLAVDALLVVLVYQHVNADPPASDIAASPADPSPTPATNGSQVAFDFAPSSAAMTDVANDGTWVFASRGLCDGSTSARVWTSPDRGADAQTRDPGLQAVQAVQAGPDGEITVAGAGDDCRLRQVTSTDNGATWTDELAVTLWTISPQDSRRVIAPDGRESEPGCTVSSLSPVGEDFARITCIDGIVKGTGNGGAQWVDLGRLDNVRTASFTTFNAGYALARYEGCAAQVFVTKDSGRSWATASCIVGDPARAIAANDTGLVAVVGEDPETYVSDDEGRDFSPP